jgi:phage protein D
MATKPRSTKTEQQTADQKLLAGFQKHQATVPSLMIAGVPVPTTSLIATLQGRIAARATTESSRAGWRDDVQAERTTVSQSQKTMNRSMQALQVMFADQIEILTDFGLTGPKPRTPLTIEQKAAAQAKAEATRAARHTMGSKQKAKIKGTVPAPAVAPSGTTAPKS